MRIWCRVMRSWGCRVWTWWARGTRWPRGIMRVARCSCKGGSDSCRSRYSRCCRSHGYILSWSSQFSITMLGLRHWSRRILRVAPVCRFSRQFSLRSKALQVAHQSKPQRILDVKTLAANKIPSDFSCAFPETDAVVVHCVSLRVVSECVQTWKDRKLV